MIKTLKQVKSFNQLLPIIIVLLTRQSRYLPEIEWSSKSWVHNIFRVYELLFWRRSGVRAEITSLVSTKRGQIVQIVYVAHTFEASCALLEQKVHEFAYSLKWKPFRIYIPNFVTPAGVKIPASPFLFAIAYDTSAEAVWPTAGATVTWSHTTTGSNRYLTSQDYVDSTGGSNVVSGVTYNSVAMTQNVFQASYNSADSWYLFALKAPASGANNVVLSQSSHNTECISTSFTGASQSSSTLDSSNSGGGGTGQASPFLLTTTVVAANSMLIGAYRNNSSTPSGGTNTTMDYNNLVSSFHSTATVSAGSHSLSINQGGSDQILGWVVGSVAPAVAASTNSNFLIFI